MRVALFALSAVVLAGCTSLQPAGGAADAVEIPVTFPEAGSSVNAMQVCYDLGMPELPALVDTLNNQSFTLRAAAARLNRADALARQASSRLWPQLTLGVGGTRGSSPAARAGIDVPGIPDLQSQFNGSLAASYEADVWGTVRSGADASRFAAIAESANFRDTQLALGASLAQNYITLLAIRQLSDLLDEQIETSRRFLELIELRYTLGQGEARDIGGQRIQLESLRSQKSELDGSIAAVVAELSNLLGSYETNLDDGARSGLPGLPGLPDVGLPADLTRQRPDIRVAYWQLAAADSALAAELNNRLPGVFVSASLSSIEGEFADLFSDTLWSLGADLSQTIFSGGRLKAQRDAAQADANAALNQYAQSVLQALTEIRATLTQSASQERLIASIDKRIVESERVLLLTREAYRSGSTDFLNVLAALQNLQGLQQQRVNELLGQFSNRIALCRALGQHVGQPVLPANYEERTSL